MSYTFPANIEREIEHYAQSEHISLGEAAVRLLKTGLNAASRSQTVAPLSEDELSQLSKMLNALDALGKVTDDQWDSIEERINHMKRSGLSTDA